MYGQWITRYFDDINHASTIVASIFGSTNIPILISSDFIKYSQDDLQLQNVIRLSRDSWPEKAKLTSEMKPFRDMRHSLSLDEDNLLTQDSCVVAPKLLR